MSLARAFSHLSDPAIRMIVPIAHSLSFICLVLDSPVCWLQRKGAVNEYFVGGR
jgi:hypothetical protein